MATTIETAAGQDVHATRECGQRVALPDKTILLPDLGK